TVSGAGGYADVESGGSATGTQVLAGGLEYVSSTGIASGTYLSGGNATQLVLVGGVASGTTADSGGRIFVSRGTGSNAAALAGGSIAGVTTLSGGTLEIMSGGTAGSSTITISSGLLVLDDSQHFSGSISGLATSAQVVDLVDINFATLQSVAYSGTALSGTLT